MEWHWKEFLFGWGTGVLTVGILILVCFIVWSKKHFDLGW